MGLGGRKITQIIYIVFRKWEAEAEINIYNVLEVKSLATN